jgi:serine/threonine protein kinase
VCKLSNIELHHVNNGIATGLHKLHAHCGKLHTDIRPQNVLVDVDEHNQIVACYLADFGRVHSIRSEHSRTSFIGTQFDGNRDSDPSYYPPEVKAQRFENAGTFSDCYSYALVVLRCLLLFEDWKTVVVTGCVDVNYTELNKLLSTDYASRKTAGLKQCYEELKAWINLCNPATAVGGSGGGGGGGGRDQGGAHQGGLTSRSAEGQGGRRTNNESKQKNPRHGNSETGRRRSSGVQTYNDALRPCVENGSMQVVCTRHNCKVFNESCINGFPKTADVVAKETGVKGCGLFSENDLDHGQFVIQYKGKVQPRPC